MIPIAECRAHRYAEHQNGSAYCRRCGKPKSWLERGEPVLSLDRPDDGREFVITDVNRGTGIYKPWTGGEP